MRTVFSNMWASLAMVFSCIYRMADAVDAMAKWAQEEAHDFEEQASIQRSNRMQQLKAELIALPAPSSVHDLA